MLALAHRAHSGLLDETVVWAYILSNERDHCRDKCSHWPIGHTAGCHTRLPYGPTYFPMSGITAELNARIGPSGTRRPATRDCHVGLHTFNERDHYRAKCSPRPIGHTVGCYTRLSCRPAYFQFNEHDHYRAKCLHWP